MVLGRRGAQVRSFDQGALRGGAYSVKLMALVITWKEKLPLPMMLAWLLCYERILCQRISGEGVQKLESRSRFFFPQSTQSMWGAPIKWSSLLRNFYCST
ncbi:unnamed protein product [Discosporangium mesarthrocarpum]